MKRIARVFLIVIAVGILVVTYWATPHLLHSQSRLINFAELLAVSCVDGFALVLLVGCVIMGKALTAPPVPRVAPVSRTNGVPEAVAGAWLAFDEFMRQTSVLCPPLHMMDDTNKRINYLCNAVIQLQAIAKHSTTPSR